MERKLQDLSDIELKAVAYDTLAQIQALQGQLNAINGELTRRAQESQQPHAPPASSVIPRTEPVEEVADVKTI